LRGREGCSAVGCGANVSHVRQLATRWRALKERFKKEVASQSLSGAAASRWAYFDDMANVLDITQVSTTESAIDVSVPIAELQGAMVAGDAKQASRKVAIASLRACKSSRKRSRTPVKRIRAEGEAGDEDFESPRKRSTTGARRSRLQLRPTVSSPPSSAVSELVDLAKRAEARAVARDEQLQRLRELQETLLQAQLKALE